MLDKTLKRITTQHNNSRTRDENFHQNIEPTNRTEHFLAILIGLIGESVWFRFMGKKTEMERTEPNRNTTLALCFNPSPSISCSKTHLAPCALTT